MVEHVEEKLWVTLSACRSEVNTGRDGFDFGQSLSCRRLVLLVRPRRSRIRDRSGEVSFTCTSQRLAHKPARSTTA